VKNLAGQGISILVPYPIRNSLTMQKPVCFVVGLLVLCNSRKMEECRSCWYKDVVLISPLMHFIVVIWNFH
jgi:hypothetical protein